MGVELGEREGDGRDDKEKQKPTYLRRTNSIGMDDVLDKFILVIITMIRK